MIGIYVRQSVDKKDSISIESQIETCKRKLLPEEDTLSEIFSDKGYSGKSTVNRPEFQRMMGLVRKGEITKIIVYKVDRISRSMLDFLKMKEEFDKFGVPFISCHEDFNTSSASGKMMLNLLVMFAEMERETIQKRITDNYYARGEKGFYLGGYAPFGYNKIETRRDGKKTYKFEINEEESKIVNEAYQYYVSGEKSLNEIACWLNELGIKTRKGCVWGGPTVSRMLSNPTYVKADADVYNYLHGLGATLNNDIEDYVGENGCIVYGNSKQRKGTKFKSYNNEFVTLGMHKGFIKSGIWLMAQFRSEKHIGHTNLGSGSLSWLQGLVRCDCCGYSEYVKRYVNSSGSEFRYFYCRGKKQGSCKASNKMIRVDFLEKEVETALLNQMREYQDIFISAQDNSNQQINSLKIQLGAVNQRIDNLVSSLADGTAISMQIINESIERLAKERDEINSQIMKLQINDAHRTDSFSTAQIIENWNDYDCNAKKIISRNAIKEIRINGHDISISFY